MRSLKNLLLALVMMACFMGPSSAQLTPQLGEVWRVVQKNNGAVVGYGSTCSAAGFAVNVYDPGTCAFADASGYWCDAYGYIACVRRFAVCAAGQIQVPGTDTCAAWCDADHTKLASDSTCAPPPPACTQGDPGTISYQGGTAYSATDWTYVDGSLPTTQCDGSCVLDVTPASEILGCYEASGTFPKPVYCYVSASKSGASCTVNDQQGADTNVTGTATTTAPNAACPTGFTANSSGVCVQSSAPVAPTAATSTTASSPGSPGAVTAYSCPAGYIEVGGVCESVNPGQVICPNGYTLNASGSCVGTATISSTTTGLEPSPSETAAAESTAVDTAATSGVTGVQGALDGAVAGYADKSGWFQWLWTPPVGSCSPYSGNVHGYPVSWDVCSTVANIRDLLGWLFAMFGAITVYGQLFRRTE